VDRERVRERTTRTKGENEGTKEEEGGRAALSPDLGVE
jgi:hypothetical protein